jgi:hypothetical protein
VSTNIPLHSLHRKCGFKRIKVLYSAQHIGGKPVDLIQYVLTNEDWPKIRDRLLPLAQLAGREVLDWSTTQSGKSQPWE